MEEERRLCYVGMTRARKRLVLTCASERRRYGGGSPEPMRPSRFLSEIPSALLDNRSPAYVDSYLGEGDEDERQSDGFDLNVERRTVRQLAENRLGGLKTYNSAENVAEFFAKRGIAAAVPGGRPAAPATNSAPPAAPSAPAKSANRFAPPNGAKPRGLRAGSRVRHPKYGRGTIMRLEGDGADAKLTVHFQQHGLKKLIAKYAALEQE
jgi:DNA helicase-2/ATP-dependent DNA helicase PcrA